MDGTHWKEEIRVDRSHSAHLEVVQARAEIQGTMVGVVTEVITAKEAFEKMSALCGGWVLHVHIEAT